MNRDSANSMQVSEVQLNPSNVNSHSHTQGAVHMNRDLVGSVQVNNIPKTPQSQQHEKGCGSKAPVLETKR